jgi:hypothetical protein
MASSVSNHSWPYPVLTRCHEPGQRPTRNRVLQTILEANANSASVQTFRGGAAGYGLLGLTTSAAEYLTTTGEAWVRPPQPPVHPVVAAGATGNAIIEANRQHKENWSRYNLMLQTDNELRNQLLNTADRVYWSALYQPITGYGRRTAHELISHLQQNYASFDEITSGSIDASMDVAWSGGPFEYVIAQIEEGARAFADALKPLPDHQKTDKLYTLVLQSGLLPLACEQWRLKLSADKTWDNARAHFLRYANDRASMATTGSHGYGGPMANHAETQTAAITSATTALVAATANMALMAKTESTTQQTVLTLQAQLAVANAQLKALGNITNLPPTQSANRRTGTGRKFRKAPGNPKSHPLYCWTHGHNATHSGTDCKNSAEGHVAAATAQNPQNGCGYDGARA